MTTGQSDTVVIVLAVLGFLTSTITALIAAYVAVQTRIVKADVASTHELVNGLTGELRTAEQGKAAAEGFTAGEAAMRDRIVDTPVPFGMAPIVAPELTIELTGTAESKPRDP